MAYRRFRKGEKAKFFVVKKGTDGRYIMTPYRSKPQNLRDGEYLASAKNNPTRLNRWGYAVKAKKPVAYKPQRMSRQMYAKNKIQHEGGYGVFPKGWTDQFATSNWSAANDWRRNP
jgi:hypothetical protein